MDNVKWTRAARCTEGGGNCLEVAAIEGSVAVRDSKTRDRRNVQLYSRDEWVTFRDAVKAGEFDHI